MGQLKGNIFEGVSGSLRNLVFYEVNGKQLVRTKPSGYRDAKSIKQLTQRQRMSATQNFLRRFRPIIKLYYNNVAAGKTAFGEAVTWHMHHALVGEYPRIEIDIAKAQVSRGRLTPPAMTDIKRENDKLMLEWTTAQPIVGSGSDYLRLVGLLVDQQVALELDVFAQRQHQAATTMIGWGESKIHFWAFYLDSRTGEVSDSVYLGVW